MSEYYLVHSGRSKRDGAKIGSGRYPLGSGKRPFQGDSPEQMSAARRLGIVKTQKKVLPNTPEPVFDDEEKNRIIDKGDIMSAYKYRDKFTNAELDAVINRYDKENKLKALTVANVKSGKDKVDALNAYLNTAVNLATNSINAYNMMARFVNTFSDKSLPMILDIGAIAKKQNDAKKTA